MTRHRIPIVVLATFMVLAGPLALAEEAPQYVHGDITVPGASADEPKLEQFSAALALEYLEQGAAAWTGQRKCVTCHTNGTYMVVRPALSAKLGPPSQAMREFFVATLNGFLTEDMETLQQSTRPAQVVYVAAGLAEWDARVRHDLSMETRQALSLVFSIQRASGTWGALDRWPPYESDAYHLATVVAMAAATAPGWLENTAASSDDKLKAGVARLKEYLRTETPPHDYSRVLLLWAATRMKDLLDESKKSELIELVAKHQRADGGWSIRTFAAPNAWGAGNRAEKLKAEPDFSDPASDGHQTGLALIVLRESGIPADDPRVQKGVAWLLANQRASGRWWTRSLNTDTYHFITYSGTAYPLLALDMCDALPAAK